MSLLRASDALDRLPHDLPLAHIIDRHMEHVLDHDVVDGWIAWNISCVACPLIWCWPVVQAVGRVAANRSPLVPLFSLRVVGRTIVHDRVRCACSSPHFAAIIFEFALVLLLVFAVRANVRTYAAL